MSLHLRGGAFVAALALATLAVAPAGAQSAETASQFYLNYRKAFEKAKSIDELLPYMSKKSVEQVQATPAADRGSLFGMLKAMGVVTGLKILKETKAGEGATLTAEGLGPDKAKTTGTIEIVKEGGAWKLGKESWSSGS